MLNICIPGQRTVVEEAILYIEELQRQLRCRLEVGGWGGGGLWDVSMGEEGEELMTGGEEEAAREEVGKEAEEKEAGEEAGL